ncbi:peptide-methionine (R)-S-oxide reductase MsrB [Neptunomonas antarctica]|uniref:peptide-methionine (R)-S-oxide reductase n=1 Tax=Neptunomonas antarctica TaxID=619304 RepID=A0A1N7LPF1_9GAMM|nr:peptide-methionine (R)-S-oxide reductase MsrB [Neptunomonas antarctica]SIS75571.1 peptide-methionine (R)-S-oxide reductase [Neptunomonas antarctica]
MNRRNFLIQGVTALSLARLSMVSGPAIASGNETFEITRTEQEWRELLSDMEFKVLRQEATERSGTSPLLMEKRAGVYHCKGCDLALYDAKTKYESGTGWPSFSQSLPKAIGTKEDNTLFSTRIEAHCRRCGGHLGHIFDDGPAPTGKRHCLNGVSLVFKAA